MLASVAGANGDGAAVKQAIAKNVAAKNVALFALMLSGASLLSDNALAAAASTDSVPGLYSVDDGVLPAAPVVPTRAVPAYPSQGNAAYRAMFSAIRSGSWVEARDRAMALSPEDPVRAVGLAELYTAKGSPKVELFDLLDLLNKSSWLPNADQLARMAQSRGAQAVPGLPATQRLVWLGAATRREYVASTRADAAAQTLVARLSPYIKSNDAIGAETTVSAGEAGLSSAGLAEVRQRVAWLYYLNNDDANARRLAQSALSAGAGGDWTVQAWWTIGLAAWRQAQPRDAAAAFQQVASLAGNDDMAAAGSYWAARSWMNAGEPRRVESLLRLAARREDSFYGMLARETLGLNAVSTARSATVGWSAISGLPNVRAAMALHEIGEDDLADDSIRREAELTGTRNYDYLVALAGALSLPQTQLWLGHHGPAGKRPDLFARFPMPKWKPDGGWRVDPALVFAHALQESGFRASVVSPAGARGLMQVMPGTAELMAGYRPSSTQLNTPSTNMEFGQRYLEQLRDMSATGGLLPKVMAAYNAGPLPVARWNTQVRDGGDPLLFIESVPYYETRAYVNTVMRNYWVYQIQNKNKSEALTIMAQGQWPRFPGANGAVMAASSPYRASAPMPMAAAVAPTAVAASVDRAPATPQASPTPATGGSTYIPGFAAIQSSHLGFSETAESN